MKIKIRKDQHDKFDDDFAPSKANKRIKCIHCGDVYHEQELVWEARWFGPLEECPSEDFAFWYCRNSDCDGMGIGCDMMYLDKR